MDLLLVVAYTLEVHSLEDTSRFVTSMVFLASGVKCAIFFNFFNLKVGRYHFR